MWQQLHENELAGIHLLGVAVDAQGPDRPRHYADKAGVTFPIVVDAENTLAKLFNYKVVPNGVLVDEQGIVHYVKIGGFEVRQAQYAGLVKAWAAGQSTAELVPLSPDDAARAMRHPEALQYYDQGLALYRQGRVEEAMPFWRQVVEMEPDNFVVRKQIWAVEHPDKFYEGSIETSWQREQISKGQ